jgi:putative lipoic acid-binding regulatory protein
MSEQPESAIQFPTAFPIKVMGRDAPDFERTVVDIVARHTGGPEALTVSTRPSAGGNFISVTVTFEAQSQAQLDAIYRELTAHELVLMAL